MTDDTEIEWHIAKNRDELEELAAGATAGADVFPETQSESEPLKAQIAQSELIVAAYENEYSETTYPGPCPRFDYGAAPALTDPSQKPTGGIARDDPGTGHRSRALRPVHNRRALTVTDAPFPLRREIS